MGGFVALDYPLIGSHLLSTLLALAGCCGDKAIS